MQAFHNNPAIKEEYLARVRAHAAADEIIKGRYWEGGRGCAVGCTIHSSNHLDYENLLGIPMQLAYLEDSLFEHLPVTKAKLWPELFLDSINVGADLSLVFSKFIIRVLGNSERGCIIHAKTPGSEAAINSVINLYKRKIEGDVVRAEEWDLVRDYVADTTANVAARAAGDAAAHAGAHAAYAAYAARAAARAAVGAYAAARDADFDSDCSSRVLHFEWMSDVLIEELKNASVS